MNINREDLIQRYRTVSDDQLIDTLASDSLIDLAKDVALEEFMHRGIDPALLHTKEIESKSIATFSGFKTVFSTENVVEGNILKARLNADNVPAYLAGEHTIQLNILWSVALGEARLRVPLEFIEEGKLILSYVSAGMFAITDEEATNQSAKPKSAYKGKAILWNPDVAAVLSLFFTPLFGATLHALNWKKLGERRLAATAWAWVAYNLICIISIAIFANAMNMDRLVIDGVFRLMNFANVVLWYFAAGRVQSKFVVNELDRAYVRASWITPICVTIIVISCLIGLGSSFG